VYGAIRPAIHLALQLRQKPHQARLAARIRLLEHARYLLADRSPAPRTPARAARRSLECPRAEDDLCLPDHHGSSTRCLPMIAVPGQARQLTRPASPFVKKRANTTVRTRALTRSDCDSAAQGKPCGDLLYKTECYWIDPNRRPSRYLWFRGPSPQPRAEDGGGAGQPAPPTLSRASPQPAARAKARSP